MQSFSKHGRLYSLAGHEKVGLVGVTILCEIIKADLPIGTKDCIRIDAFLRTVCLLRKLATQFQGEMDFEGASVLLEMSQYVTDFFL